MWWVKILIRVFLSLSMLGYSAQAICLKDGSPGFEPVIEPVRAAMDGEHSTIRTTLRQ